MTGTAANREVVVVKILTTELEELITEVHRENATNARIGFVTANYSVKNSVLLCGKKINKQFRLILQYGNN